MCTACSVSALAREFDESQRRLGPIKYIDGFLLIFFGEYREITFENAEELTEEGLPFLILFHAPNDTESIKDFKSIVESQLLSEKRERISICFTFVTQTRFQVTTYAISFAVYYRKYEFFDGRR